MATGLNTYAALYNNEMDGEILRRDAGFTFVDFLPGVIQPSGFFRSATYENFRTLVDRANEFLRSNRKWKIVTCESVEFKSRGNKVDPIKMTYLEYGETYTSYIRGLRLWLTEREDEKEREQQIGYVNLIPQQVEKGGIFRAPKFETLNAVIDRFNSMLQSNPLPGVTDIIPGTISEGGIFSLPQYEPFSNVMHKASVWLAQQRDIRFCNAQTLEIKVRRGKEVNTQRMDFTESGSMTTYYVRILRMAYTKTFANPYSISEKPSPIRELTCRTFPPLQLSTGVFVSEYENLVVTRERISAWVKATGARVVSAETTTYRVRTGGERKQGTEATFTYNTSETNEYWMFVIRLYLDGVYKEPPPEMLPALPGIEQPCCHVS